MIAAIWAEWEPYQDVDNTDETDIENMTLEKTQTLLEKYAGIRHLLERMKKIKQVLNEIRTWKKPQQQQSGKRNKNNSGNNNSSSNNTTTFSADHLIAMASDEKMASKLTSSQKQLIR